MTIMTQQVIAALTSDGGSNGVITVADTSQFEAGAVCYLSSNNQSTVSLVVDSILSSTQLTVKVAGMYTRFPANAYTVAQSAKLTQPVQVDFNSTDNGQEIPVGGAIVLDGSTTNSQITYDGTNVNVSAPVVSTSRFNTSTFGDSTATPGNATLNNAKGRSALANAATTVTITNSLVTANDVINVQWETALGAGITHIVSVVAGSFTVTASGAVTGNKNFRWNIA